ncbi:MAG: hypothetical protein ACLPWS_02465 [Rhodomicrobium sp.]
MHRPVLTGWWRKKAVNGCPGAAEMWLYWQYTKAIERDAGSREAVRLPEAEKQKNKAQKAA